MALNIITISRQFGSGGHTIAKLLSEALSIPFYDKELLCEVAKKSGYTQQYIEKAGEYCPCSGWDYLPLVSDSPNLRDILSLPQDNVQRIQNELIINIANQGPCVIVGRAADYLLRERNDVLNVFVHADEEYRIKRILEEKGVPTRSEAIKKMNSLDKLRKKHYYFCTDRNWGDVELYDITLNTAVIPIEMCVEMLKQVYVCANESAKTSL